MDWSSQQERLSNFFAPRIAGGGETWRQQDYGSAESQRGRYRVLSEAYAEAWRRSGRPPSILDVGCGLGDLPAFLTGATDETAEPHLQLSYWGLDLCPEMVAAARARWARRRPWVFALGHILDPPAAIPARADWVVSNGIFYLLPASEAPAVFQRTVAALWQHCRVGVALMTLSAWAPAQPPGKWLCDPVAALEFARTLSPLVTLRHDYATHDFCLQLWRPEEARDGK